MFYGLAGVCLLFAILDFWELYLLRYVEQGIELWVIGGLSLLSIGIVSLGNAIGIQNQKKWVRFIIPLILLMIIIGFSYYLAYKPNIALVNEFDSKVFITAIVVCVLGILIIIKNRKYFVH